MHTKGKSKFEHQDTIKTFRRNSHWNFFECEANQFVAELLIPKLMLNIYMKEVNVGIIKENKEELKKLARKQKNNKGGERKTTI